MVAKLVLSIVLYLILPNNADCITGENKLKQFEFHKNSIFYLGYYWRDYYNSSTPSDAFEAGTHKDGKKVYVGQGVLGESILPGMLHRDEESMKVVIKTHDYTETHKRMMVSMAQRVIRTIN